MLRSRVSGAVTLLLASCNTPPPPIPASQLSLRVNPQVVCLPDRQPQYLSFDLVIANRADRAIKVKEVRAAVLDGQEVIEQRQISQNAAAMLGPNQVIEASSEGMLFNPLLFNALRAGVRLRYDIAFEGPGVPPVSATFAPQSCSNNARLMLPMTGRILVSDGFDMFSHHRRREYLHPFWKQFGVFDINDRFGLDLVMVDIAGRQFRGRGTRNEDFYAWGQPLRAPADGVVNAVHNTQPDNTIIGSENLWTVRDVEVEEMGGFGNYILIDHGKGEFSLLAHARAGSVRVKKGQQVRAGEVVAQVGNSGAALGPHLHYELRSGWGLKGVTGKPAYFNDVRVVGTGETGSGRGVALDTGDIVIAR